MLSEKDRRAYAPIEKVLDWERLTDGSVLCYYDFDPSCFDLNTKGRVIFTGSVGIQDVAHDYTLVGKGTEEDKLKVKNPYDPNAVAVKTLIEGAGRHNSQQWRMDYWCH